MDIARPSNARRKRMRQIAFAAVGIIVVSLVSYVLANLKPAAPVVEAGTVWEDTVKRGPMPFPTTSHTSSRSMRSRTGTGSTARAGSSSINAWSRRQMPNRQPPNCSSGSPRAAPARSWRCSRCFRTALRLVSFRSRVRGPRWRWIFRTAGRRLWLCSSSSTTSSSRPAARFTRPRMRA